MIRQHDLQCPWYKQTMTATPEVHSVLCCWDLRLMSLWPETKQSLCRTEDRVIYQNPRRVSGWEFSWLSLGLLYICWKRPWCWEELGAGGEEDNRGWDGWMASPVRWTWVWVNPGSWWWTRRPGVLRFVESQRVVHDWATELNWTELWSTVVWKEL